MSVFLMTGRYTGSLYYKTSTDSATAVLYKSTGIMLSQIKKALDAPRGIGLPDS